jgi:ribosomal protein S18 acetylase RimI-like enzyme
MIVSPKPADDTRDVRCPRDVDDAGEITVRPARVDDVEGIAEVHVAGYEAAHRGLVPDALIEERTPDLRRRIWRERLTDPPDDDVVIVAEAGGRIVGFVSGHPTVLGEQEEDAEDGSERIALWESLYVEPAMIGTDAGPAVGTALADRLRARFSEMGFSEVTAYVHEENLRGSRYLEKIGFRRDGGSRTGAFGTELRIRCPISGEAPR